MKSQIVVVECGGPGFKFPQRGTPQSPPVISVDNRRNRISPAQAMNKALKLCKHPVTIFAHDDLTIHDEDWLYRINSIGQATIIGLGGALALGSPDLYRKPYDIWQLARRGYVSNQTDAETHGERFTGLRRCAVVEQFFFAVRTDWLKDKGGFPTDQLTHHCIDMWLACEAARDGKEVWQVGVSCTHHGGGSSTKPSYGEAPWLQGGSMERDHQIPHRWIYDSYVDCLPIEVP